MKVELTKHQVEGLLLSIDEAILQLKSAKNRNSEFESDIEDDIYLINRIKKKVVNINRETYVTFTKYETCTLISVASNYEELHEQPQDTIVNKVVKVKLDILDVIKSPLPYIDIINIRMSKED